MVKVIGLGAQDRDISLRGMQAIESCERVFVKTEKVESANFLVGRYESFDNLFDESQTFDELNEKIVERLTCESGDTCYLVPYSPYMDTSVLLLASRAKIEVFDSASHAMPMATGGVYLSAYSLPSVDTFCFDKALPLFIYDIDSYETASGVKLFLCEIVGDEEYCHFCGKCIKVYEIDRQKKFDYESSLVILPKALEKRQAYTYYDLIEILLRLRKPNGCKWDRAQTHLTLKKNLLEEANELIQAIDKGDIINMQEECGDVLLQPVFHAAIANEENEFSYRDMINTLCKKLIFRHSYVFGDDKAETADAALELWNKNKIKEKQNKND